mmetsp:Transcript_12961/g.23302  ORF Transcript_12961/g.23302 Transcript_12961/m.23302 type:complete len:362 (+) Transcript_12961:551-1636(+)
MIAVSGQRILKALSRQLIVLAIKRNLSFGLPQKRVGAIKFQPFLNQLQRFLGIPTFILHDRPRVVHSSTTCIRLNASLEQLSCNVVISFCSFHFPPRCVQTHVFRIQFQSTFEAHPRLSQRSKPLIQMPYTLPQKWVPLMLWKQILRFFQHHQTSTRTASQYPFQFCILLPSFPVQPVDFHTLFKQQPSNLEFSIPQHLLCPLSNRFCNQHITTTLCIHSFQLITASFSKRSTHFSLFTSVLFSKLLFETSIDKVDLLRHFNQPVFVFIGCSKCRIAWKRALWLNLISASPRLLRVLILVITLIFLVGLTFTFAFITFKLLRIHQFIHNLICLFSQALFFLLQRILIALPTHSDLTVLTQH